MQFCELGEIHAIARSVSRPLHRSQVGEGADGGDRVRGDLDKDLVSLQLGEGRHPLHPVQYLDLTVFGLDLKLAGFASAAPVNGPWIGCSPPSACRQSARRSMFR
jgi:hypothetical protein